MFMPQQPPPQQMIKFRPEDLNFFKNIMLFFIISKLAYIGTNIFISSLIGMIFDYAGTIVLIYGIFTLSKKYSELVSGVKVALLFIIALVVDFISVLFINLYPIPATVDTSSIQNVIEQLKHVITYFYIITAFTAISGVIVVISAYYFTQWINLGFNQNRFTEIKSFFYYGIIFCIAQILIAFAFLTLNQTFTNIVNTGIATQTDVDNQLLASNIANIGYLLILAGLITEIVASIKIYNRVNDFITGKYFYMTYQLAYQQAIMTNPQQFYQQPFQTNPYQQPFQNNSLPSKNNLETTESSQELPKSNEELNYTNNIPSSSTESLNKLLCKNCSMPLPLQTKFCFRCGAKVD